ncbi:hypothetical protein RJ639_025741 [Escallonia herrerae]|uniref:Homeobox domain-containing protein n=1 Tax=Escallonia herrerae TaxID=1293975 RepID=A0AA88UX57_9ASTE|nr:hypothetical protein RJ639_025741 [Escallonia herrerae]
MSLNRKAAAVKHGADMDYLKESEFTPKRRSRQKLDGEGTSNSLAKAHTDSSERHCSHNSTTRSSYKRLGEDVTQRLLESFRQNQYPERAVKEILAKDLALTFQQVDKWFGNARWSFRHTSRLGSSVAESVSDKSSHQTKYPEPEPKLVTEDAACNILEEKELPKAIPDGENVRVESLVEKGGNGVDFRTPKSRRIKVNLDHQVTDSLPNMETPVYFVHVTLEKLVTVFGVHLKIVKMEAYVLKFLNFEMGNPTTKTFLRIFTRFAQENSMCLALQESSGYGPSELKDCVFALHSLQLGRRGMGLRAVRGKYMDHKFVGTKRFSYSSSTGDR